MPIELASAARIRWNILSASSRFQPRNSC